MSPTTILLRAVASAKDPEQAGLLRFVLPSTSTDDVKCVTTPGENLVAVDFHTRFIHPDVPDAVSWPRARRMLLSFMKLARAQGIERIYVLPDFLDATDDAGLDALVRGRKAWVLDDSAIEEFDRVNYPALKVRA